MTIETSRFNYTPHWLKSITKALIHCWNKMSSLNDPAQTRPQMLVSKQWNRKCPIQFHPMYCTQWCHSSFARCRIENTSCQTWHRNIGIVSVKWSSSFVSIHQHTWWWRPDPKGVWVGKTEGFSPISKSKAVNFTQRQCQAALIRKRIKIQCTRSS